MSNFYPIIQGFRGGEISPRLRGLVSSDMYKQGMSICENWLVEPQGSIRKRAGTQHLIQAASNDSRLIPFDRARNNSMVLEFYDQKVRLLTEDGNFLGENLTQNNKFDEGFAGWIPDSYGTTTPVPEPNTYTQWLESGSLPSLPVGNSVQLTTNTTSNDAIDPRLTAEHGAMGSIRQFVNHPTDTSLNFAIQVKAARGINALSQLWVRVGTTEGGVELVDEVIIDLESYFDLADAPIFTFTFTTDQDIWIETIATTSFGTGTGNNNEDAFVYIFETSVFTENVSGETILDTPYLISELEQIQFVAESEGNQMIFAQPNHPPQRLFLSTTTDQWTWEQITITMPPEDWTTNNYPSVVEIYQSRLWFAATETKPSTLWASSTAQLFDFTVGANPADGMDLALATTGKIQWVRGQKVLFIGTDRGEWTATATGGVLIPSDFQFDRQSGYGSLDVQPAYTGDQISYIGFDAGRVYALNFDELNTASWVSNEISFHSEQLFKTRIKNIDYARDPDYQMYCLNLLGSMITGTYDRIREVSAWWRFIIPNASINSNAVIGTALGAVTFLHVIRNGVGWIEIFYGNERRQQHLDASVRSPVQNDNAVNGAFSTAFNASYDGGYNSTNKFADGFERHEGTTIEVVVLEPDTSSELAEILGFTRPHLHPPRKVVNGRIQLESWAVGEVIGGFGYEAKLKTLKTEGGNAGGTSQGTARRWNRVFGRLDQSAIPVFNGYRPQPLKSDIPEILRSLEIDRDLDALVTGDYDIRSDGFDDGVVEITQDLPLRTHIAAVFGKSSTDAT